MKRPKIVDIVLGVINQYQYIGTKKEKVSITFEYLLELRDYIRKLEETVENQEYKNKQLNTKVDSLLKNQLEKLNKTINHLI